MYTFKLVHLTLLGKQLFKNNNKMINDLLNMPPSTFKDKQIELVFIPFNEDEERIKNHFRMRKDYQYFDHYHYVKNQITKEQSYCIIHKYDIIFKSDTKNNIFYEVFYQKQENCVIIDE